MKGPALLRFLAVSLVLSGAVLAGPETHDPDSAADAPTRATPATNEPRLTLLGIFDPLVGSNRPASIVDRLVDVHDLAYLYFNGRVADADAYFGHGARPPDTVPQDSFFCLELTLNMDKNASEFGVSPRLDARLAIPRIEARLHAYADNIETATLPGSDRTEQRGDMEVGLRAFLLNQAKTYASVQGGLKFRSLPVVFGLGSLSREVTLGRWTPGAKQEVFWYSDDGFGEYSEVWLVYALSRRMPLSLNGGAKWTEQTLGVEFSQSLALRYLITEDDGHNSDESVTARASVFEHKNGPFLMDNYRVNMSYRRRLFRHWLFGEITPQLDFPNSEDYTPQFSIELALDILFFRDPTKPSRPSGG